MTNQVTYLFFHGMEQISEYLFTTEEQAVIGGRQLHESPERAGNQPE